MRSIEKLGAEPDCPQHDGAAAAVLTACTIGAEKRVRDQAVKSSRAAERPNRELTQVSPASFEIRTPKSDEAWAPYAGGQNCKLQPLIVVGMLFAAFSLGWLGGADVFYFSGLRGQGPSPQLEIAEVAARIIEVESNGDSNAKNKRSTAMGLGQFLDETWLEMIRVHRPDLGRGRSRSDQRLVGTALNREDAQGQFAMI